MKLSTAIRALLSALIWQVAHGASAADFPTKPIRMILPFPAGSGSDQSARVAANYISRETGQPVIVDNRPGASGFIAAQAAAQAAPDGHTIFVTTMTTQSVNPHIFRKLPYEPAKDFAPVALLSQTPMVLVVANAPGQPRTAGELIAKMKSPDGNIKYASGNTSTLVAAGIFSKLVNAPALNVPYKGVPQALNDLMGGRIDFMYADLATAVPLVQQGKLRALGATGLRRIPTLPEVPTMRELGTPIDITAWAGAFVPSKTPQVVIVRLNELIVSAMQSKEAQERLARNGAEAPPRMGPEEFGRFTADELELWGRAVRSAGIQPE
jgi:tripartite-type tricarboxylate transporter receptor subunit TctC